MVVQRHVDSAVKEVREKHYPGYHYTIFKTPDPEAPGGWKQIFPDRWRTLPDNVNKDAIFYALDDPNRPGKKLPHPVRRPWSRLVRWLGLKGIHFDSGGLDPSPDDGVDIDGIDGTGPAEAAPTAGTTMAEQLMAYAQRCLARDRASGENMRRAWPQYERIMSTFENFVLYAYTERDAQGNPVQVDSHPHPPTHTHTHTHTPSLPPSPLFL